MSCKISVIIPTYNRASLVQRAVDSVLGQTWQDFELHIVDDGSTDSTPRVLEKYEQHPQVRLHRTENRGVSAARNYAIRRSEGEWLAFLDSDDEWLPNKLQRQMDLLSEDSDQRWVHGEEIWIRNGVRVNPMHKHRKSGGDIFASAVRLCCVSPSAVMIHRSLLQEVGVFREDFPVCEDYDLWLRIAYREPVAFVPDPVVRKYGGHEDQLSRRFFAMDYWRIQSLSDLLQEELTPTQRELVQRQIRKKAKILLKGYRKHENLTGYDLVFRAKKMAE